MSAASVPPEEKAAGRAGGLHSSPVIVATAGGCKPIGGEGAACGYFEVMQLDADTAAALVRPGDPPGPGPGSEAHRRRKRDCYSPPWEDPWGGDGWDW